MELQEITEQHIKYNGGKQIVIVALYGDEEKTCLTFLVDDCEKPMVPGFPAVSLSYFDTVRDARKAIVKKYDEIGYPKNNGYKGFFSKR